jgi:hypothetical protein
MHFNLGNSQLLIGFSELIRALNRSFDEFILEASVTSPSVFQLKHWHDWDRSAITFLKDFEFLLGFHNQSFEAWAERYQSREFTKTRN